jgi:6-phosphogluconolactonase
MNIHTFASQNDQMGAIAHKIHGEILQILKTKPTVTIAVSGGKSPIPLFKTLSELDLPWQNINITLVDERIVDTSNPDSNEYLIRNHLLKNYAIKAKFIGIIPAVKEINGEITGELQNNAISIGNVDIAILGMGEDGHTASIFPNCVELKDAIDLNNKHKYIITHPISAEYERVSMTLSSIVKVPELILCINGHTKFDVLNEAVHNSDYPIHYLIKARSDLQVYYFE